MAETFVQTASASGGSVIHTARHTSAHHSPAVHRPARDIEPRLARRRAIEAEDHVSWMAHRAERIKAALLKSALRMGGLYRRGITNALRPSVHYMPLEFARLPRGLDGFRILHLSDLHIDGMKGLAEIVAEQVATLPVDLCVLTGDYRFAMNGPCQAIYPLMGRVLEAIRSRHGVIGILGNHDCADIAVELEKAGVRMLINEGIEIGTSQSRLWVAGVDDPYHYRCDDLAGALEGAPGGPPERPDGGFKLLLAHTPEIYGQAAAAGIDLYLAGHTHAGQICLPWLGPLVLQATCPRAYTGGLWRHGAMQGYTSAGVGCSLLPVRFGCPPEIVVFELRRAFQR